MYECPFCGITYDYEYFREDDVLSRASEFLRRGEWVAATDAYDFLLTKEPHNFEALLGKILAAAHMKRQEEMANIELFRSMDYKKVKDCIRQALRDTDSTHKDYFEKVQELFSRGEEYYASKDNIEDLMQRRKMQKSKLEAIKKEISDPLVLLMLIAIPLVGFGVFFLEEYFQGKSEAKMYQSIYAESTGNTDIYLLLFFVCLALLIVLITCCLIKYFRAKKAREKDIEKIEEEFVSLGENLQYGVDEPDSKKKRFRSLYYEIRKS